METRAERDDELRIATIQQACPIVSRTRHRQSIDQVLPRIFRQRELTAISGLSAKTYSCGGDGSRFGGGVSDSFLKYFAIPVG